MIKRILGEAAIVILVAGFISVGVNLIRPAGLRLFESSLQTPDPQADREAIREITVEEAIAKFDDPRALFADARSGEDFAQGHIQGALSLPAHELDAWIEDFISNHDPATHIITYCDGPRCPLAKELAHALELAGYEKVFYLTDGWQKWNDHGMPVATGE
ncbi:MAG: rhodanese-like domain-containing protein [Desulfobacterales bacterium]|nr:MAG: rhodanese-like domain-containing protein [Desulfobacterales bacterium]